MKETFETENDCLFIGMANNEDIVGNQVVDGLQVLISGSGDDQVLRVPKLVHGIGKETENAVHQLIIEWNLID